MKKRVTYSEVADSLVRSNWGWDNQESKENVIKSFPDSTISKVLLVDIAKSLRKISLFQWRLERIETELVSVKNSIRKGKRCHKKHVQGLKK